jgi:hypothetical protein
MKPIRYWITALAFSALAGSALAQSPITEKKG